MKLALKTTLETEFCSSVIDFVIDLGQKLAYIYV